MGIKLAKIMKIFDKVDDVKDWGVIQGEKIIYVLVPKVLAN